MARRLKLSSKKIRIKMQFTKFLQYFKREFAEGRELFKKLDSKRYFNEQFFRMLLLKSMDIPPDYKITIEHPYPNNEDKKIDFVIDDGKVKSAYEIKYLRTGNIPTKSRDKKGFERGERWRFLGDISRLCLFCKGMEWERYLFLILDKLAYYDFEQNLGLIDNYSQFTQNLRIVKVQDEIVLKTGQNEEVKLGRNKKYNEIDSQLLEIKTIQKDYFNEGDPRYFFYFLKINPL